MAVNVADVHGSRNLRTPWAVWALFAMAGILLLIGFSESLKPMVNEWLDQYSHALIIPVISAYMIWQKRGVLARIEFRPRWEGLALTLLGGCVHLVGQLSSIFTVSQWGLLLCVYGLVLSFIGWNGCRQILGPLAILALMIPLPEFVLKDLSESLQLVSSQVGVWFMRLFGITVYLEGNIIDLGTYKLQVAEACSGLRYLFPLMTLSILMAYLFRVAWWKRVVLFLSSIPVSVLMNSLRVGIIGILVEHWGSDMAEGFLHQFQGWAVFMVSFGLLFLEMTLLTRIGAPGRPWRDVFGVSAAPISDRPLASRRVPMSLVLCCSAVLMIAIVSVVLPYRKETVPAHRSLVDFPSSLAGRESRRESLDPDSLIGLGLDDYLLANYAEPGVRPINLYIAWYASQQAGRSAHSPASCLPGGGWQIARFDQVDVANVSVGATPLRVNRALIRYGNRKQLVYYWFQQRGRVVTNEYLVKWFLFWDGLVRNRSDGALVRVSIPLPSDGNESNAERELAAFLGEVGPRLQSYVPG